MSGGSHILTDEEKKALFAQTRRPISLIKAQQLEREARRYWDIFYKRNGNRFFRDRHWTGREFPELNEGKEGEVLLELGCGVGNLVIPLLETNSPRLLLACDLSPRAVNLLQQHPLYDETKIKAFEADITSDALIEKVNLSSVQIITMMFVLSTIHPDKFSKCATNAFNLLKPGGLLLFRDYARYDMAQIRFKPGHLISENFYMRQDGTRSYFFELNELAKIFNEVGFQVVQNQYVERRTINKKEDIDVPRFFVQAKFQKPL